MASPKYVAHRGLSMHAPENTIAAFEAAGEASFWGIECDTYCTVDGRWIVHHDKTVDRMTNGTGPVKDFTFEELRRLDITSGFQLEAYPGQKIPPLEDVLAVCKRYGMHAFIEIEQYHRDADLEELVRLADACGMLENSSFICFNADYLRKVRAIHPNVPLGFLSSKAPKPEDLELVRQLAPAFLNYHYKTAEPEQIRQCAEAGIDVSLWTVNTREEALPLIEAGAAYITTDTVLFDRLSLGR